VPSGQCHVFHFSSDKVVVWNRSS